MKKFTLKNIIIGMLAIMMFVTLLAGCQETQENSEPTAEDQTLEINETMEETAEPTEEVIDFFAKYDPAITITTVKRTIQNQQFENPEDSELDNNWTRLFEDYGINIEVLWTADASQYEEKCNLAIASGEIPDVMRVFDQQANNMRKGDMVMDMKDIIDERATDLVKKILYADGGVSMDAGMYDDEQLFIPTHVTEGRNYFSSLWIRADWLENAGMDAPESFDEFLNICEAFTNGDPDGNGKDDTYALGVAGKDNLISDWGGLYGFFPMFHVQPGTFYGNQLFYEKDSSDKIIWSGSRPETKKALEALQDMYSKGYLAQDFGTVDAGGKLAEDLNGNKCGMFFGSYWQILWPLNDGKTQNPDMEWTVVAAPTIDGEPYLTNNFQATTSWFAISKECENPEAVILMLNIDTDIKYGGGKNVGVEDITKFSGDSAGTQYVYIQNPTANADNYALVKEAINTKDPSGLNDTLLSYYEGYVDYAEDFDPSKVQGWGYYSMYNPDNGIYHLYYDERTSDSLLNSAYWGTATDLISLNMSTYTKLAEETITKIIYGQASADEWDEMIAEWNKLAGDSILSYINEEMSN